MAGGPNLERRLKLQHLRLLSTIAEAGSIGRAAARLNLTQPAATRSLREMERLLGAVLFDRGPHGTEITAAGRAILKRARAILAEVEQTGQDLLAIRAGRLGSVNVGMLLSASVRLLPDALALLRADRPDIDVRLVEGANDTLMPALRAGELDIVVGRLPEFREREGIVQEPLYDEPGCLVVGPGHGLAAARDVTLGDLAGLDWLLPPEGTTLRRRLDQCFREAGLEAPRPAVVSVSLMANQALLRADGLIGMVPEPVAREWSRQDLVRILPLSLPLLTGAVGLSLAKGRPPGPATAALIAAIRKAAKAP